MSFKKRGHIFLKAAIVLVAYFIVSNFILVKAVVSTNTVFSYGSPMVFGIIFSLTFLYIFSHEDFFKFAKTIEKKEEKIENKLLHLFGHLGKSLTTLLIGIIAGPIFVALTARLLLHRASYKYPLVVLAAILSTFLYVGTARGILSP